MVIIGVTLIICITVMILFLTTVYMVNKPKVIAAKADKEERDAIQMRQNEELSLRRFEMMTLGDGVSDDVKAEMIRATNMAAEVELNNSATKKFDAQRLMHAAEADKNRARRSY